FRKGGQWWEGGVNYDGWYDGKSGGYCAHANDLSNIFPCQSLSNPGDASKNSYDCSNNACDDLLNPPQQTNTPDYSGTGDSSGSSGRQSDEAQSKSSDPRTVPICAASVAGAECVYLTPGEACAMSKDLQNDLSWLRALAGMVASGLGL